MKFRTLPLFVALISVISSCQQKSSAPPIIGTWELVSATASQKDTTFSTFNPNVKMIKMINPTHFAFMSHDRRTGKDSAAAFSAGGGKYTLADSVYTEHLEYYIDPAWENNKFEFVVKIAGDTLVQKGVEKVEKLGIDRIITETYVRVND
ncbi:hypothetical protein ACFQ4C_14115 [Larkinella insperata]|uniref:Lipocalin-like domain-containing protein n=1 Tax=Larkinella insperata TaxID=332158 RepID=A0ABW3Q8D3_9BACT|nr:hypothetical protein [Larkinella insperata]